MRKRKNKTEPRYVIAVDPAVKTLALSVLDFEDNQPDLIYRGGKAKLKFFVFTDIQNPEDVYNMFKFLSNIIDFKETLLIYERFVVYGKFSMKLIEKVNQIIGYMKLSFRLFGGFNIKEVSYEKWIKEAGRRVGMKNPKYYKKNVRSKVIFDFMFFEAPTNQIESFDKSDHLIESILIGITSRKPVEN